LRLKPRRQSNSLEDWVKPKYTDVVVCPKAGVSLGFYYREVPGDTIPGSHWAGSGGANLSAVLTGGGAASRRGRNRLFLLRVFPGEAKEKTGAGECVFPCFFIESPPYHAPLSSGFQERRGRARGRLPRKHRSVGYVVRGLANYGLRWPVRNVCRATSPNHAVSFADGFMAGGTGYTVFLFPSDVRGQQGNELVSAAIIWVCPWAARREWEGSSRYWRVLAWFVIWKRRNFWRAWLLLEDRGLPPPKEFVGK